MQSDTDRPLNKTTNENFMRVLVMIVLCAIGIEGYSQTMHRKLKELESKMLEADSVIILSHDDTNGFSEDEKGNAFPTSPLLLNEQLNDPIIHEKLVLNNKSVIKLSKIAARPNKYIAGGATCFSPHHSIAIVKNGKYSYIEICFGCHGVRASADIDFSNEDMDEKRWSDLFYFFKQNNFKYEL